MCRVAATALFLATATPQMVTACSCIEVPVETYFDQADAVFLGRVIDRDDASEYEYVFTFDVRGAWKGVATARVKVRTEKDGGSCGYGFRQGDEYLVFAGHRQANREEFVTGLCSGTADLTSALTILPRIGPPAITFAEVGESSLPAELWMFVSGVLGILLGGLLVRWCGARSPSASTDSPSTS